MAMCVSSYCTLHVQFDAMMGSIWARGEKQTANPNAVHVTCIVCMHACIYVPCVILYAEARPMRRGQGFLARRGCVASSDEGAAILFDSFLKSASGMMHALQRTQILECAAMFSVSMTWCYSVAAKHAVGNTGTDRQCASETCLPSITACNN